MWAGENSASKLFVRSWIARDFVNHSRTEPKNDDGKGKSTIFRKNVQSMERPSVEDVVYPQWVLLPSHCVVSGVPREVSASVLVAQVLVIEDDLFLQKNLLGMLLAEGYHACGVNSGEEALERLEIQTADMVILDQGLPGMDGLTTCRRIRRQWQMPVLMLSACTDAIDKAMGLETGADDYLSKPFESVEFMARVRAHLRRRHEYQDVVPRIGNRPFQADRLKIDFDRREVTVAGRQLELTSREFEVLAYLAKNCDRALSRDQVFEHVWGFDQDFSTNSLDVHIYRLRKKLEENPESPRYLHTIRGYGYKLGLVH